MTEYWKSNERKYCDFCKCWLSDNKASISFHENGKRHKLNVAKRITDISRSSDKAEREQKKMNADIRKMEEAAMKSYAQDVHAHGDMTARSINTVMNAAMASSSGSSSSNIALTSGIKSRQVDPMRLEGLSDDEDDRRVNVSKVGSEVVPDASLWVEGKSEEGYTYYWNVKTNESVWQPPKEGYLSYEEYERINQLAINQQELKDAEDALKFRANADEEVARYNRERMKAFRQPETAKEIKKKEKIREEYKTEEEAATKQIGQWETVESIPPPAPIDWQLPSTDYQDIIVPAAELVAEPPAKRFKEKTIGGLDDEASTVPATFKKRKFAGKGNARKRLDD